MMKPLQLSGFTQPHVLSRMAENTPILVAFSGGADSSALLALLISYAKETGAPLSIAHIDHKLRGKDSDSDREFCRAQAKLHGLPFYVLEEDVSALAAQHHTSIEEEARRVRYDFFASLMKEHHIPILATAHNADDNAETVIFNIARGTGLRGLCGIPESREFGGGMLIRPLLSVPKAEILDFCGQNCIPYVTDASNSDTVYTRNRIRHLVIPQLREINSAAVSNLSRLCTSARRDEDFLEQATRSFLEEHETESGVLPLSALQNAHPAIAARAVGMMLARLTSDVRAVHIDDVLALSSAATPHSSLNLCDGARALIENGTLVLTKEPKSPSPSPFFYPLHIGENPIPEADLLIVIEKNDPSHKNQKTFKNIYKKSTTTCISSDKIYDSFIVRSRHEGDKILAGGMHKKVKKLLCDKKIPPKCRDRLPVFCDSEGILWIPDVALRDGAGLGSDILKITVFYQ